MTVRSTFPSNLLERTEPFVFFFREPKSEPSKVSRRSRLNCIVSSLAISVLSTVQLSDPSEQFPFSEKVITISPYGLQPLR